MNRKKIQENWILPKDTIEFLMKSDEKVENYALCQNNYHYFINEKKNRINTLLFKCVCKNKNRPIKMKYNNGLLEGILNRQIDLSHKLFRETHKIFSYRPDIGLILGTGSESVSSSVPNMTLHPVYGIPYIPASGIKGAIRNYYIIKNKSYQLKEENALKDEDFLNIFGCDKDKNRKARKGKVIFLDAFPETDPIFYYEKFAPHYSEYYNQKNYEKNTKVKMDEKMPSDDGKIIPLSFPAIKETNFQIIIGCDDVKNKVYLDKVIDIISESFEFLGIGGKSSVGFGVGTIKEK